MRSRCRRVCMGRGRCPACIPTSHVTRRPASDLPEARRAGDGAVLAIEPVTVPLVRARGRGDRGPPLDRGPPPARSRRCVAVDRVALAVEQGRSRAARNTPGSDRNLIGQPIHLDRAGFPDDRPASPDGRPLAAGRLLRLRRRGPTVGRTATSTPGRSVSRSRRSPSRSTRPTPTYPSTWPRSYATAHENGATTIARSGPAEPLRLPLSPDDLNWAEAAARRGN